MHKCLYCGTPMREVILTHYEAGKSGPTGKTRTGTFGYRATHSRRGNDYFCTLRCGFAWAVDQASRVQRIPKP